jgi:hypothetical protein
MIDNDTARDPNAPDHTPDPAANMPAAETPADLPPDQPAAASTDPEADIPTLVDKGFVPPPPGEFLPNDRATVELPAADAVLTPGEAIPPLSEIDAALTALDATALSDLVAQQEAVEEAERRSQPLPVYRPNYPMPPLSRLRRGSLGSIVPALLLMIVGAWLTLTTTGGLPGILPPELASALVAPSAALVAILALGVIAVSLLAHAVGSGRWTRGALFVALLLAALAVVLALALQPGGIDLARGYPLLLIAFGVALALAGQLSRPLERRAVLPGALLAAAGVVGLALNTDMLAGLVPGLVVRDVLAVAAPFAPVVLAALLLIWLAPSLMRRNRSAQPPTPQGEPPKRASGESKRRRR